MKKFNALALVLALVGCGGGDSGSTVDAGSGPITTRGHAGSCHNAAGGFCNEFSGSSYTVDSVQKSCGVIGGMRIEGPMFLPGLCPTEGRVGTCLVNKGKGSESPYRYYANFPGDGKATKDSAAASAEMQCKLIKGEWSSN